MVLAFRNHRSLSEALTRRDDEVGQFEVPVQIFCELIYYLLKLRLKSDFEFMEGIMSKSLKCFTVSFLFLAGLSLFALAADVSGTWEFTMKTPRGDDRISEVSIEQDGEKIKVTMEGFQGDEIIGEGTVKDNNIEWTMNMSSPRGDFSISYSGTVDGDSMSGKAEMGDFGAMEWTAKKK
jgi:hypothetical protein